MDTVRAIVLGFGLGLELGLGVAVGYLCKFSHGVIDLFSPI